MLTHTQKILLGLFISSLFIPLGISAQLTGFSRDDLVKYTADSPFERFEDGRHKVPDHYIEALKNSS